MSVRYLHFPEYDLLFVRVSGCVSRAENAQAMRAVLAERQNRMAARILLDADEFSATELESHDFMGMVESFRKQAALANMTIRIGLFGAEDSFGYAMSRVFHAYAGQVEGLETAVFQVARDALCWLGLDGDGIYHALALALIADGRRIENPASPEA